MSTNEPNELPPIPVHADPEIPINADATAKPLTGRARELAEKLANAAIDIRSPMHTNEWLKLYGDGDTTTSPVFCKLGLRLKEALAYEPDSESDRITILQTAHTNVTEENWNKETDTEELVDDFAGGCLGDDALMSFLADEMRKEPS